MCTDWTHPDNLVILLQLLGFLVTVDEHTANAASLMTVFSVHSGTARPPVQTAVLMLSAGSEIRSTRAPPPVTALPCGRVHAQQVEQVSVNTKVDGSVPGCRHAQVSKGKIVKRLYE